MNDPRRLLDEGSTGFESKLLRAGREDAPAPDDRKRIAAALGIGAAFTAGTLATGASAAGKTWFGFATAGALRLAAGVTAGALAIYGGASIVAPRAKEPGITPPVAVSRPPAPTPRATALPVAAPTPAIETAAPVPRRPAPASSADTLADELAMLDRARRALAQRDYGGALAHLDEHSSRFPKRHLASEASVLRIEALMKSGDTAQATRIGKDFLSRHPNGPYAKRVTSLIGDARATSTPGQ